MSEIGMVPTKVLFASHGAWLGGAERCLLPLATGLNRDRFHPVVVVPQGGPLVERLEQAGIPVLKSPSRWWATHNRKTPAKSYLFHKDFAQRVRQLGNLIERENADVVISNSFSFLEGAFAARLTGRPHIWNVLEILSKDPGLAPLMPRELVYSWLPQLTDRLVVVSQSVADEFKGFLPPELIQIIHTGIPKPTVPVASTDVRTEFGFAPDSPVVQYVGILSERKGVRTLITAIPHVLETFPQAKFLFAGTDGGLKSFLVSEIDRLNLSASVKLLGQRNDIGRLVSESSLFVLPANADPLPVAVLEAMALGKPVVATRSGGCSEMVEQGKTGLLVEPQSPPELAQAIVSLLSNPGETRQMGERGLERFQQKFSLEQYVESFETLIDEIVKSKKTDANRNQQSLPELPGFDASLKTRFQATILRTRERYHEIRNSLLLRLRNH